MILPNEGPASSAKIATILTTTSSSISVKPFPERLRVPNEMTVRRIGIRLPASGDIGGTRDRLVAGLVDRQRAARCVCRLTGDRRGGNRISRRCRRVVGGRYHGVVRQHFGRQRRAQISVIAVAPSIQI